MVDNTINIEHGSGKHSVTGGLCWRRWEAHIWVKELGRQVYLGGYEHEEHAAEAYDVAALKCKGFKVKTNFDIDRQGSTLVTSADKSGMGDALCLMRA